MERTYVQDLPGRAGERVRIAGWLHQQRRLSRLIFLLLRDRSGIVQVVVEELELVAEVAALHPESVVEIEALAALGGAARGGAEPP